MFSNLPAWLRIVLAFAFIGAVVTYGQRIAAAGTKKIAGGV